MPNNNFTDQSLTLILWNTNGLLQHRLELETYLHHERIDIALITESHLTSRSTLQIRGYNILRTDHPDDTGHGGSAILIRRRLQHCLCPLSPPTNEIQATAVTIQLNNQNISFASVYCPPRFRLQSRHFEQLTSHLGQRFVVGGDFNAKHPSWGSRLINPRGRVLYNFLLGNNFRTHSPLSPTYWPAARTRQPDILDFLFSKGLPNINFVIETDETLSSDHSSLHIILNSAPTLIRQKPRLNLGFMNWEQFQEKVQANINLRIPLKTTTDIDEAILHFNETVQNAAWSSSYEKTYALSSPTLPRDIRLLIREKRQARHIWQTTRFPADRRNYNKLSNQLKRILYKYKSDNFGTFITSLHNNTTSFWKTTKHLLKHPTVSMPLKKEDNSWTKDDKEKANLFATHLEKTFQPHPDQQHIFNEEITQRLTSPLQLSLPPELFKLYDIKNSISSLSTKKSPGYDLITNEILQNLPEQGVKLLLYIFNSILRVCYFPAQWKFATIVLFPKPGKPGHLPSSYRPISLLSMTGKLLERLLLPRLALQCDVKNTIPTHQFGFRPQHSTIHQLHRVVDFISDGIERKLYTTGAFLDIKAAFDKVWHDGLLCKLKEVLSDSYFRIVKSFLEDRYFKVNQNCQYSELHNIQAGVPQGSVLSPLLYNVFTSDMPTHDSTLLATYADDTAIMSQDVSPTVASQKLQYHLSLLERWLTNWKIKVNTDKCVQVTFTLRRDTCPEVHLSNLPLPQKREVRYLGLWLDRRLTWRRHLRSKRLELNRRLKYLFCLIGSRSKLNSKNKLLLYKTLFRPIWSYGIQLFGSAAKSNLQTIQTFQSKFLRLAVSAPYYVSNVTLHSDLKIPLVVDHAKVIYRRFHEKLDTHPNQIVQHLASSRYPLVRRLRRKWSRDLLH
jgi:hypothetical protein